MTATGDITYVVPRFRPSLGGIENHVEAIGSALRGLGWGVEVATQIEATDRWAAHEELADGLQVERFRSRVPLFGQGVSVPLARYARTRAATGRPVHLHNYHALTTLFAGRAIRRAARTGPIVITPHYLGIGAGRRQQLMHALYGRAFQPVFAMADAIVAVCASEARLLVEQHGVDPSRITVIPNGVDAAALGSAVPFPTTQPCILVAGRLLAYKGHLSVLRALTELPGYRLVIAGHGPLEAQLRSLAAELGVSDRLELLGGVAPTELARWYATASVVVSMSSRECFGLTLVEGIAAGAPIVASDIGPHRDVFALCGYPATGLVPLADRPAALAAAIRAAVEHGRHQPGAYSVPAWSEVGARHAELYRRLIDGQTDDAGSNSK